MPDWGKSKRPARERSLPPPRDPRVDSEPPSGQQEKPLERVPSLRPSADAAASRVASLEAEVARLKREHASDADQVAEMLVRIAAVERARSAAEARLEDAERARDSAEGRVADAEQAARTAEGRAIESDVHAEALSVALGAERQKVAQLEAEGWEGAETVLRDLRAQAEALRSERDAARRELAASREAMAGALAVLEDLERREEMVASIRLRAIEEMRRTLGGPATLPPLPPDSLSIKPMPIRSVAPLKPLNERMAEPEPFLDLDLRK